ncbi:kinesin-like protein KIN-10B [Citrus sinensis]|uniref:Kinesin-like protein KIN-10B n=1 Tax=Citrus sinensis TaxID=2711 RepID=A0ACB8JVY1_CITSI|nr:kinesin-like protein KIN-10B [Citrus sinensis]
METEYVSSSFNTPSKSTIPNSTSTSSKVRVIVRARPFLSQEIAAKNGNSICCISVLDRGSLSCNEEVAVYLKDPDTIRSECYQLDSFFGQEDESVSKIFYSEVNPLIPGIFHGRNATVFAYGATGSGKTYTMQGSEERPGLMPLAMSKILSICQSTGSTAEISYYEVYMDRCYDLLEVKTKEISILDDKDGQLHLKGLSRVPVNSMTEFQEIFSRGIQRRKVAHTGLNDVSSRSHGVLVISVSTLLGDDSKAALTGKLNLIDLAGNEDNRRTCNEGIRLLESAKINQSLFALSNVIHALNNNKPRVPYRESKLTRILQDSLGGTSHALMVACLNPGEYQESVHTVSLAARSRHISNTLPSAQKVQTPMVKIDMEAKLRAWLESKGKTKSAQRMAVRGTPIVSKTPTSVCSVKKTINHSCRKVKVSPKQDASNAEDRALCVPFRNLLIDEGLGDSCSESHHMVANDTEEITAGKDGIISISSPRHLPDEQSEEKATFMNSQASPVFERKSATQSPLRTALSPININANTKPLEKLSDTDQHCPLLEPKTPRTPFTATCASNKFQPIGTPLDKFSARSIRLKNSLVQEYIDFLNTASREELVELKGIGQRLADYICELRQSSPVKSAAWRICFLFAAVARVAVAWVALAAAVVVSLVPATVHT